MSILRFVSLPLVAVCVLAALPASAQVPPNCEVATASDPDRQVLSCDFGVIIELEAAASMGFVSVGTGETAPAIDLQGGAALIEAEPGEGRPQIRTPHAIAAVRGTVYIVDVTAEQTSVFVVEGEVEVTEIGADGTPVRLGAGDGIDVGATDSPLTVRPWPDDRAATLLARFGR